MFKFVFLCRLLAFGCRGGWRAACCACSLCSLMNEANQKASAPVCGWSAQSQNNKRPEPFRALLGTEKPAKESVFAAQLGERFAIFFKEP